MEMTLRAENCFTDPEIPDGNNRINLPTRDILIYGLI